MVFMTAGLDLCAATMGLSQPHVGAGCGVLKTVIDVVNNIVKEIEENKIKDAVAGSIRHGEGAGVAIYTLVNECSTAKGEIYCGKNWAQTYTKYMPL